MFRFFFFYLLMFIFSISLSAQIVRPSVGGVVIRDTVKITPKGTNLSLTSTSGRPQQLTVKFSWNTPWDLNNDPQYMFRLFVLNPYNQKTGYDVWNDTIYGNYESEVGVKLQCIIPSPPYGSYNIYAYIKKGFIGRIPPPDYLWVDILLDGVIDATLRFPRFFSYGTEYYTSYVSYFLPCLDPGIPKWEFDIPSSVSQIFQTNMEATYKDECGTFVDIGPGFMNVEILEGLQWGHLYNPTTGETGTKLENIEFRPTGEFNFRPWGEEPLKPERVVVQLSSLKFGTVTREFMVTPADLPMSVIPNRRTLTYGDTTVLKIRRKNKNQTPSSGPLLYSSFWFGQGGDYAYLYSPDSTMVGNEVDGVLDSVMLYVPLMENAPNEVDISILAYAEDGENESHYGVTTIQVKKAVGCPIVSITPATLKTGDTATVTVRKKLENGTIVDYPAGQQFTFTITSGAEFGTIVGNTSPAQFIANANIDVDSAVVTIRAAVASGGAMAKKIGGVQTTNAFECSVPEVSVGIEGDKYPPCVDSPTKSIEPKRMDNNGGCTSVEAGATYANFDPEMNDGKLLLDIGVCADPATKKARVQLSNINIAILFGICYNSVLGSAQQLRTVNDITSANACQVKREFEIRIKQLRDNADSPNTYTNYYTEDEILNHEETHARKEQQYLEQAFVELNKQLREMSISKEILNDISKNEDKRLIFANTVIFKKLKDAYNKISPKKGTPSYFQDEIDSEENQAKTLDSWLKAANSKCQQ